MNGFCRGKENDVGLSRWRMNGFCRGKKKEVGLSRWNNRFIIGKKKDVMLSEEICFAEGRRNMLR
jgi:hypothetical protein